MNQIPTIAVREMLGWQRSGDDNHAVFGFKDRSGQQVALAVPSDLIHTLAICAKAMTPKAKDLSDSATDAVNTDWFVLGEDPTTGDVFLTFFLPDNGHMGFRMDRIMASRLLETLHVGLQGSATGPTPGTPRN